MTHFINPDTLCRRCHHDRDMHQPGRQAICKLPDCECAGFKRITQRELDEVYWNGMKDAASL